MKDFTHLTNRFLLILLSSAISACMVVPEKVASYDEKCKVSTEKIELSVEQMQLFDEVDCLSKSCKAELLSALFATTLVTTTSAIVSGSVALVGNTLYWMESQGKCPNVPQPEKHPAIIHQDNVDEKYKISEEIVPANS